MDRPPWIGNAWSLKDYGLFRIALVDRPRGLDSWTVPRGLDISWSLKNKGLFRIALVDGPRGLDLWTVPRRPSLVDRPHVKP